MNIRNTITPLLSFESDSRIAAILRLTEGVRPLDLENISEKDMGELRTSLLKLLADIDARSLNNEEANSLADTIYTVLIDLAKLSPINHEDFSTFEAIPPTLLVVASTGHQFNIETLIHFHEHRDCREETLHEKNNSKYLVNPITNQPFSRRDVQHIKKIANEKGITILFLKEKDNATAPTVGSDQTSEQIAAETRIFSHYQQRAQLIAHMQPREQLTDDQRRALLTENAELLRQSRRLVREIYQLNEPIRHILLSKLDTTRQLIYDAHISLHEIQTLYSHNLDHFNLIMQDAPEFVSAYQAGIPWRVFIDFPESARSACSWGKNQIQILIHEANIPPEQFSLLGKWLATRGHHDPDPTHILKQLVTPACIRALKNGQTTLERLSYLDAKELREANNRGRFPPTGREIRINPEDEVASLIKTHEIPETARLTSATVESNGHLRLCIETGLARVKLLNLSTVKIALTQIGLKPDTINERNVRIHCKNGEYQLIISKEIPDEEGGGIERKTIPLDKLAFESELNSPETMTKLLPNYNELVASGYKIIQKIDSDLDTLYLHVTKEKEIDLTNDHFINKIMQKDLFLSHEACIKHNIPIRLNIRGYGENSSAALVVGITYPQQEILENLESLHNHLRLGGYEPRQAQINLHGLIRHHPEETKQLLALMKPEVLKSEFLRKTIPPEYFPSPPPC